VTGHSGAVRTFGATRDGTPVHCVGIAAGDLRATVLTYGATLQDIRLAGVSWPLTLGSEQLAAYEGPMRYFGAIVGPVANRISGAAAEIAGRHFRFDANEAGRTTLHGGASGTFAQVWQIVEHGPGHVSLSLGLADGIGGFPGNRHLTATFRILPPATLVLQLSATTDTPTLINLANHSYWNLDGSRDTTGQVLSVAADRYTPVDKDKIPTGTAAQVAGTPFDLRRGQPLAPRHVFDHNFCLADAPRALTDAAQLTGTRGVSLQIATTEPGLQVFDGASLTTAPAIGLTGQAYGPFAGVALETQRWPDAANQPGFPSILLHPGQPYTHETQFGFRRD
jgi:aldose 1-epimerase